jgi:hypothetical protein
MFTNHRRTRRSRRLAADVGCRARLDPRASRSPTRPTATRSCGDLSHTVVDRGDDWFTADVMAETIAMSTLAGVAAGSRVN